MFRKIVTVVLLSAALKLNGQMESSFRYNDSITYSFYTEKRWDDLISAGHNAVKNGHDYYYLRMRIGIAYYEKENYAMSVIQFRKALEFNENDQIALEYLFYSYYLSGHPNQALTLMSSFYPQGRERILKESKIRKNNLTVESFFSDSGTDKILTDPDPWFSDPEPGSQIATKYFINNSLYASHFIGDHVSYSHSFTNLVKVNYLHYFDGIYTAHLFPQRIIQNQYYGSFSFFTSTGWVFSPAFHFLTAGYPLISISVTGMNTSVRTNDVRSNGYFTGLSVTKSMGFMVVGAETGYSYLNYIKGLQATASLMVYPLGNTNIYFGGNISTGKEINMTSSNLKIAGGFIAGISIGGKVWLEFSGLKGDMNNYSVSNGLYIYNSADILKSKFTGRVIIPFNKAGLIIFAGGGKSSYSSEFIAEDGLIASEHYILNYNSNNFTGGISWNF